MIWPLAAVTGSKNTERINESEIFFMSLEANFAIAGADSIRNYREWKSLPAEVLELRTRGNLSACSATPTLFKTNPIYE